MANQKKTQKRNLIKSDAGDSLTVQRTDETRRAIARHQGGQRPDPRRTPSAVNVALRVMYHVRSCGGTEQIAHMVTLHAVHK